MKLYSFFRSSAAFRVRIALNYKGIPYEQSPIHFRKDGGQHKLPEFLSLNPQGLLPLLEDDDFYLQQSLAIIEYLDEAYPNTEPLLPSDPKSRGVVRAMAQMVACDLHPLNNLSVLNYLKSSVGVNETGVNEWYRHWVAETFKALEVMVSRFGGVYCFGDNVSLVDVCLVPQVYNAVRFNCDLTRYPTLSAINTRLLDDPAFRDAMPENQPDAE